MSRLQEYFRQLRTRDETALIPFLTLGDPSLAWTRRLILAFARQGADIIEIGIPFSDPLADGPTIQASSLRALRNGTRLPDVFEIVRAVRRESEVPLVLFTYCNPVIQYRLERFFKEAKEAGADGAIIPDLPVEESEPFREQADRFGIDLIPLVAPTSQSRIRKICESARGFVYCVSSLGVTGVRDQLHEELPAFMSEVRRNTAMPLAIGFGVGTPEQARSVKPLADGVVVGSAIVRRIAEIAAALEQGNNRAAAEAEQRVIEFVGALKQALQDTAQGSRKGC
jgi:tryptophan synthase alpha chain